MKHPHALTPSELQLHVNAWKARAFAALRADSSLSVRLARYNAAMTRARELAALAERQSRTLTQDPRLALASLKAGRAVRIQAQNLRDHLRHAQALAALEAQEVRHA
ncbi:MAG TPA: hypothetical protein VL178_15740 [Pseudomonas sp.]|nr:hypothetical protein [Pseudomonas sp.]